MNDFYRTQMGRKFYEVDFPKLVENLGKLAEELRLYREGRK